MTTIVGIEGPAGSGKGTWCEQLRRDGMNLLHRPALPRVMDEGQGAASSSYLEYEAVCRAASGEDVLVDRFLLSRFVYASPTMGPEEGAVRALKSFAIQRTHAAAEMMLRGARAHDSRTLIVVLLPNPDTLKLQRVSSGRRYKLHPTYELAIYSALTASLVEANYRSDLHVVALHGAETVLVREVVRSWL